MNQFDFFTGMLIFGRDTIYELQSPKVVPIDNNLEQKLKSIKSEPCLLDKRVIITPLQNSRSVTQLIVLPLIKVRKKYVKPVELTQRQGWNGSLKIRPL